MKTPTWDKYSQGALGSANLSRSFSRSIPRPRCRKPDAICSLIALALLFGWPLPERPKAFAIFPSLLPECAQVSRDQHVPTDSRQGDPTDVATGINN